MKESLQQVFAPLIVQYLKTDSSRDLLKPVKSKLRSVGPLNARAQVTKKYALAHVAAPPARTKSNMSVLCALLAHFPAKGPPNARTATREDLLPTKGLPFARSAPTILTRPRKKVWLVKPVGLGESPRAKTAFKPPSILNCQR